MIKIKSRTWVRVKLTNEGKKPEMNAGHDWMALFDGHSISKPDKSERSTAYLSARIESLLGGGQSRTSLRRCFKASRCLRGPPTADVGGISYEVKVRSRIADR